MHGKSSQHINGWSEFAATGKYVVLDSGLCVLIGIAELKKKQFLLKHELRSSNIGQHWSLEKYLINTSKAKKLVILMLLVVN